MTVCRTAMVLTAGRGQRLRPLTDRTPKPMIEVGGEPLLAQILRRLRTAGVATAVLNLHHLGAELRAWAGDGSAFGLELHYSEEPTLLETGGGIRKALPLLSPDGRTPFLVVNGDVWSDIDPAGLPDASPGELAHLVLVPRPPDVDRGDYALDPGTGVVRRATTPPLTFAGVSRLHPRLFDTAPPAGTPFRLPALWSPWLDTARIRGSRHDGAWFDIGTPARLARARAAVANRPPGEPRDAD